MSFLVIKLPRKITLITYKLKTRDVMFALTVKRSLNSLLRRLSTLEYGPKGYVETMFRGENFTVLQPTN